VDYFDGNTVTALWNYAQPFARSDNSFNTTFGPSTPGALNLISGQTHGMAASLGDISGDVVMKTVSNHPQSWLQSPPALVSLLLREIKDIGHGLDIGCRKIAEPVAC